MEIFFFPNGRTVVFKDGQQVPELNESWISVYLLGLASIGVKLDGAKVIMPDAARATIRETEHSYKIEFESDEKGGKEGKQ